MSIQGFEEILREHPAFSAFDDDTRALLAGCAMNEQVSEGGLIYREGDTADRFYLLRRGDVAIEIVAPGGAPIVIETMHPGDMLGWGWIAPPHVHMSDARARTAVSAVSLDAECMRRKCQDNPALGYAMFQHWIPHLTNRIRSMRMQLMDLYAPKPSEVPVGE
jgi:CRP-like cAMP-binding protein